MLCRFWTTVEQFSDRDDESIDVFLRALRNKLINNSNYSIPMGDCSPLGRLAVADIRLCFQYEPYVINNKSMQQQAELVASHMRVAYSVPVHREHFRSGYPSEPMLAEVCSPLLSQSYCVHLQTMQCTFLSIRQLRSS